MSIRNHILYIFMSIQKWKTLSRLVPPSYPDLSCPLEVCTCCLFLSLKKKSDALNKLDKINKSLYNPKFEIYVTEINPQKVYQSAISRHRPRVGVSETSLESRQT